MKVYATRAIERFRCITTDCEDNCCDTTRWVIHYDRAHYEVLAAKLPHDELIRTLRVNRNTSRDSEYASIINGPIDGSGASRCAFLSESRCSIHERFGAEALGDICAVYPRPVAQIGQRLEQVGMLSCPEVTRLSLLANDGLDLFERPLEHVERLARHTWIAPNPADLYQASFRTVNAVLTALLRLDNVPLSSRLFFLAFFGDQTRSVLCAGNSLSDSKKLEEAIGTLRQQATLTQLHRELQGFAASTPFAMQVVGDLLLAAQPTMSPAMLGMLREVAATYGFVIDAPRISLAARFAAYERTRARLSPRLTQRLDTLLTRYARHTVMATWYLTSPSLLHYVFLLLARIAVIRFLLLGQPSIRHVAGREDDAAIETLDRLVVRTIYLFSRSMDHATTLAETFAERLAQGEMTTLTHGACLATF